MTPRKKPKPVADRLVLAELTRDRLGLGDWVILRMTDGSEHPIVQRGGQGPYLDIIWEDDDLCWSCVRFLREHGSTEVGMDEIEGGK